MTDDRFHGRLARTTVRVWLIAVAILALPSSVAAQPPNVIVILIDDLRWDELGAAGHPVVRTPHIDRLARDGARFQNAFVTTPLCSPSRASFLTGQYARTHGITDNTNRSVASHHLITFPRLLQQAGYETAFVGKWHMGNDDSRRPGFDTWVSFKGQGEYRNPEITEGDRTSRVSGYITDILNERALAFVRRPRSKPFLLYLSHKAVHPNIRQLDDGSIEPIDGELFVPAERHRGLFADAKVPHRPNFGTPPVDKPALMRKIGDLPPLGPGTVTDDATILGRERTLAAVDDGVGQIVKALEEREQLANTLIIFAGDNGYFYGEHGLNEERRLAYEESARIPIVVRYPPLVRAGSTPGQLVLNIDIAPTVLEVAGVARPAGMEGQSLVPLFRSARPAWRSSFVIEYFTDTVFPRVLNMGYQCVRTGRWKYIRYLELRNMDELYDLQTDPYELQNVIGNPSNGAQLQRLQAELDRLLTLAPATPRSRSVR